jgi:membrane-bound serine protease (ClpP class)
MRIGREGGVPVWTWVRRALGVAAALVLVVCGARGVEPQGGAQPSASAGGPGQGGSVQGIPAARAAKNVVIITIDRPLDSILAKSVARRLKEAEEAHADAVVFELDTPGGELGAALEICSLIKRSPIPNTVAWVNSNAYSGGAIIALACREIVVGDYATVGDALLISMNPLGMLNELPEHERQKMMAPLLAEVVDSARRRGYDEKLVQGMVSRGVELWLIENTRTGQRMFIDRAEHTALFGPPPEGEVPELVAAAPRIPASGPAQAPTPASVSPTAASGEGAGFTPASPTMGPELIREVAQAQQVASTRPALSTQAAPEWKKIRKVSDGTGVVTLKGQQIIDFGIASQTVKNDRELAAFFGAAHTARLNETWSEHLVVFMNGFIVRAVLLVIFLLALFIEMTHPGLTVPGLIAAVALIALLAPPFLNNMASWWEIAAIIVGIFCIAVEILVIPGFGVFGVGGLVLLFVGLVGTFVGGDPLFPDTPGRQQNLLYAIATVVISGGTTIAGLMFLSRHLGGLPVFNKFVLKDIHAPGEEDEPIGMLAAMAAPESGARAGDVGVAITPLHPAGRVQVGDDILDVVAEMGFIAKGTRVRLVSVDAFRVTVEPAPSAPSVSAAPGGGEPLGGPSSPGPRRG